MEKSIDYTHCVAVNSSDNTTCAEVIKKPNMTCTCEINFELPEKFEVCFI